MNENNYGQGLYSNGVFFFTNPTKEDWSALWNNKEYTFKAMTTSPFLIANETPENIQVIRKMFAKRLAQHVFHQSKQYRDMVKSGGFIPATYNEDGVLKETIQACLKPLPQSSVSVKDIPRDSEDEFKLSKAVVPGANLAKAFEDYQVPEYGEQ